METEWQQLTGPVGAEAVFALPAVKMFKLRAYFAMDEGGQSAAGIDPAPADVLAPRVELSRTDRIVIDGLQGDLPLVSRPFNDISARLGIAVEELLATCQSLKQRGVIRRFGAAINHKQAGFKANAMACWVAPLEMVDIAGQKLAELREVSHCYERKTNPLWRYNLFAMIHGHTRGACHQIAGRLSDEMGLKDYVLLFSAREFKKIRVRYQG